MKPHHIFKASVASALILGTSCSMLFLGACEKEKISTNQESLSLHSNLKEQQLAVIEFEEGVQLTFRTEVDGVVFEMFAPAGSQNLLPEDMKNASPLKLFLFLTDKSIRVPEDLLVVEKDNDLIAEARNRGLIQVLDVPVKAKKITHNQTKDEGDVCSGTASATDFFETIPSPIYYKFFTNYTATASGIDVYSSAHPSANQCNKAYINLTNCSDASDKSLEVKIYRKVGGIYYEQNTIVIPDGLTGTYHKSYTNEYYQKINIQTSSASAYANKYGGYVEYYDYD